MATLAAFFRRIEVEAPPVEEAQQWLSAAEADPYRLRLLPNEQVHFFAKQIDNSRVVRHADPVARRRGLGAIGVACLAAAFLIFILLPEVGGRVTGYQLCSLQQQHEALTNQRAALELEEAKLLSPERLEDLARLCGQLVQPALSAKPHASTGAFR